MGVLIDGSQCLTGVGAGINTTRPPISRQLNTHEDHAALQEGGVYRYKFVFIRANGYKSVAA